MTYEQNVKAVLECCFSGFKEEIIDGACKSICELHECDEPFLMKELKSCPLCGEDADIEEIINPLAYWDSALRGEHSYTVFCYECGLSIKDDNRKDAIIKWNALPRIVREKEE